MLKDALSRMADVFLPAVLMQGQEYQQKGYVLNIRLSEGLLKARVKGSSNQIYNVHIDLKSWPAQAARCSCPFQLNCKHAAASLFSLQIRENVEIPAPVSKTNHSLQSWLSAMRQQEQAKKTSAQQVIYLLEPNFRGYEPRLMVQLAMAKQLKRGNFGKKIIFHSIPESRKQYFTAEDEEIISALVLKTNAGQWFDKFNLRNSDLIEKILLTGRAYLRKEDNTPLVFGEAVDAQFDWKLTAKGEQVLTLKAEEETIDLLLLDKAWYVNEIIPSLGHLQFSGSLSQLKALLSQPPVPLTKVPAVAATLAKNFPQLPPPKFFTAKETNNIEPQPLIIFDAIDLENFTATEFLFIVDLAFDYGGIVINEKAAENYLYQAKGQILQQIQRNKELEKEKIKEADLILKFRSATIAEKLNVPFNIEAERILTHIKTKDDLPRLYSQLIPALQKKGWKVSFTHPVYEQLVEADDLEWFSEVEEQENNFFSYQLGIIVEGEQVSIVPLIADLINRIGKEDLDSLSDTQRIKLPLPNGKFLHLALERIKPLLRFLLHYGSKRIDAEHWNINRYQLVLMQETEEAIAATKARWRGAEKLRASLQRLAHLQELPAVAAPQGLKAVLRDYQQHGLNWLQFLRQSYFGGILADDMGLGKTVQTLAHLQVEKEQCRLSRASLIIAPTSLVANWYEEAKRFTPALKILVFHGSERYQDKFANYDVIISTYGLVQRDKSRFVNYHFYYLILDEAQFIKNARTKTTQIIQQLQADHRLCLSGTPLENHLGELWSLFHFLMPGLLGDAKQFRQFFKNPIEKFGDEERRYLLAKRVQPFMLRRNKNQVAKELPDKIEMTRNIELTGSQRDLYEAIRMSMEKKVREAIAKQGLGKSHIVLLDALLKLRQVCCDPRLLSIPEAKIAHGVSAKLDTLMELLSNLMDEGRRVLVFSQFTSMLELIEQQLKQHNYSYLKLTGQTQNRLALVNRFQEGGIPIFLISLKAGGTGLNLTQADTVIHYDPWWNPAVENQATDRSHRIGQENPVFVYKLITKGTVEEAILSMQEKKRHLFEGVLTAETSKVSLSKADIDQFFMPLPTLKS